MRQLLRFIIPGLIISGTLCGTSCRRTVMDSEVQLGDTLTTRSKLLTMIDAGDYILAEVTDPWNQETMLARYIIVDRDSALPTELPDGTIIRTPLSRSTVYSSVHAHLIEELGAVERIKGVADGSFYKMPSIVDRLKSGEIIDIGSSMSPTLEKLIMLRSDAVLLSPFQNAGHGIVEKAGAPIIECADYMEETPLGRAEWIKFFGALYGQLPKATEIFDSVTVAYNSLLSMTDTVSRRPTVISEMLTDGVWYVPGGHSYMARLFLDAGASYPWSDDTSAGSLQLDFPAVYAKGNNADVWLIRTYGYDLTLHDLLDTYSLYSGIKAFSNGGVYSVNTAQSPLFEEYPFHPELLLSDLIKIFHPELSDNQSTRYYTPTPEQ